MSWCLYLNFYTKRCTLLIYVARWSKYSSTLPRVKFRGGSSLIFIVLVFQCSVLLNFLVMECRKRLMWWERRWFLWLGVSLQKSWPLGEKSFISRSHPHPSLLLKEKGCRLTPQESFRKCSLCYINADLGLPPQCFTPTGHSVVERIQVKGYVVISINISIRLTGKDGFIPLLYYIYTPYKFISNTLHFH